MAFSPIHGLGGNTPTGPTSVGANAPTFSAPPPELSAGPGAPLPRPFQNYLGGQYTRPAAPTAGAQAPPLPPTSTGGSTLSTLLGLFPGYQQALALQQEGIGAADAQLNAQRQQAIINFGDPALASEAGFGLDPQAAAFAQQNYLSGNATMARLDKSHKLASQAVVNALAAHGLLSSGDLGYREGAENQAYGNNVYDARQSVLSQLAGLYNNYLNTRNSLGQNVTDAINAAMADYLNNPDAYAAMFGGGNDNAGGTDNGGGVLGSGSRAGGPGAVTAAATVARRALAGRRATPLPTTRVKGGRI